MDYKKKLKYISEDAAVELSELTESELVTRLKEKHSFLEEKLSEKKGSALLKEIRAEVLEFRKNWALKYPEKVKEIEDLKEQIKHITEERDAKIEEDIAEKKDLEAGYNDQINACKEYIDFMVFCLRCQQ